MESRYAGSHFHKNQLLLVNVCSYQISVPSSTEKTDLDLELSTIHGSQSTADDEVSPYNLFISLNLFTYLGSIRKK